MSFKRWFVLLLTVSFLWSLSGCNGLTMDTEQMIRPPQLTGEMKEIDQALSGGVKGAYKLLYPSAGDRRSAIITEDVDGDGILEAFAFFTKEAERTANVSIALVRQIEGEWQLQAQQSVEAGGVECVEFCDLDGSGWKSILVGLEVFGGTDKLLAVYNTTDGKLSQRMKQQYNNFLCCNLDEDDKNEIFIESISPTDGLHRAALFSLTEEGITELSTCLLDKTVKTVGTVTLSELSSGQPAIYMDEAKGTGAITEVVYLSKGMLTNPLLDAEIGENIRTLHAATLTSTDINMDGTLEIPVSIPLPVLPGTEEWESLSITGWFSFNGERLDVKQRTFVNASEKYMITFPEKWTDKILLKRDADKRSLTVYTVDTSTQTLGESLAVVRAFTEEQWNKARREGTAYKEISRNDEFVYGVMLSADNAELSVPLEDFRKLFTVKEW